MVVVPAAAQQIDRKCLVKDNAWLNRNVNVEERVQVKEDRGRPLEPEVGDPSSCRETIEQGRRHM